jgi:hypothetical protein
MESPDTEKRIDPLWNYIAHDTYVRNRTVAIYMLAPTGGESLFEIEQWRLLNCFTILEFRRIETTNKMRDYT